MARDIMSAAMAPPRVVRAAFLSAFAEAARSVELEPFSMMRRCGVPLGAADDPELKIAAQNAFDLLSRSAAAAGREDFGLLAGDAYKPSMLGPLILLIRAQATLRDALEVAARYLGYQTDAIAIRLEDLGDGLAVAPHVVGPAAHTHRQAADWMVTVLFRTLTGLAPAGWKPRLVCFAYPAPEDPAPYRRRFGQVEFGHEFNGLVIETADLARPLPTADAAIAHALTRLIESNRPALEENMTARIGQLIERLLPTGDCTVHRAARLLGVDRRTIHRRLASEGVTFTTLVDRKRRELAAAQLRNAGRALTEVADLLGFSSLSTFSRWFRRSHGANARDYRKVA
jgi:AraC-like DNA-binding protein